MRWGYQVGSQTTAEQLESALHRNGYVAEPPKMMPAGSGAGTWVVSSAPRSEVERIASAEDVQLQEVLPFDEQCDRCGKPATKRFVITPPKGDDGLAQNPSPWVEYRCAGCAGPIPVAPGSTIEVTPVLRG